jgi:transcriptional regulator with XRE-family HTH domain
MKKKTLRRIFSANLRFWRTTCKLSQLELAAKAGLHVSYISMLERGVRSPPLDTVELLSLALKVPPAGLLME